MKEKKAVLINILKVLWIIYAGISAVVTLRLADHLLSKDFAEISEHISLDDGWDITVDGEVHQNTSLKELSFPAVRKGDTITMQRKLPDHWDFSECALRLHIRQTAIQIYIDDDIVYEYGYDRMAENKTVGSGIQFIDFPDGYQGRSMKIHLYAAEDKAFTMLEPIRLYEWKNAYRALVTENRVPLFLGSFLVIFGLATIIITMTALIFSIKYIRLFCLSFFSICIGLWTLCYYNVIMVFSIPLYSVSLMEYIALYLSPVPLTIYMHEDVKHLDNKPLKLLYWILLATQILFVSVSLGLHTSDTIHMAATLPYMQTLIIFSLVYFFFVILLNLKTSRSTNRLYLIGSLMIDVAVSYDLVAYCRNRYFGVPFPSVKGISAIGVMIFVFILFCVFYIDLTQKMMQEKERSFLLKSAYTDELTQLHNRRYCIEYMNKISQEQTSDFSIICFDLNNLKKMNDVYGHAKGDILIKSAAEVIEQTYGAEGIVARMGGDEFIAVLDTADEEKVAALARKFRENIDKKNLEVESLDMSIAFGHASGSEREHDVQKVYQIADSRMYEHKKQMKEVRDA